MSTFISSKSKTEVNARDILKPGTIVFPCADEPITAWPADKGGYFVKISQDGDDWVAITNKHYSGRGLIVFVDSIPTHGQKLKIKRVSRHVAYADLA